MIILKKVRDFTVNECTDYLRSTPDGTLAPSVRARLDALSHNIDRHNAEVSQSAPTKGLNFNRVKWIDANQFLEGKKYAVNKTLRAVLLTCIVTGMAILCFAAYYCLTETYMYSSSNVFQAENSSVIDSLLLRMEVIRTPGGTGYGKYDFYWGGKTVAVVTALLLLLYLPVRSYSSRVIPKIYNIEDRGDTPKYRAVQSKNGKVGIVRIGRFRIKAALPLVYDEVFPVGPHDSMVYIVKRGGRYGIFSTQLGKLTAPAEYDSFGSYDRDTIRLIKGGVEQSFNYRGYRIVK